VIVPSECGIRFLSRLAENQSPERNDLRNVAGLERPQLVHEFSDAIRWWINTAFKHCLGRVTLYRPSPSRASPTSADALGVRPRNAMELEVSLPRHTAVTKGGYTNRPTSS
jgi:hypothetical protein